MCFANMRANGVRAVIATCEACNRSSRRERRRPARDCLRASRRPAPEMQQCGGKAINTRPAWHTARDAWDRITTFGGGAELATRAPG